MKMFHLSSFAAIMAVASAGRVYNLHPQVENYANTAEIYQSQLEYQQHGLYSDQSQAYTGHEAAYKEPSGVKSAKILNLLSENDGHGYKYAYETENGIKAEEHGQSIDKGTEAHGAFSYTGDDGQTYSVTYTADENGFHPEGAHLPTPPPIPEAIAKSIEQNARDEAAGIFDDGKYVEVHQGQGHIAEDHEGDHFAHGVHPTEAAHPIHVAHPTQIAHATHVAHPTQIAHASHVAHAAHPAQVAHAAEVAHAQAHAAHAHVAQSHGAQIHVPQYSAQLTHSAHQHVQYQPTQFAHFEPSSFQASGISGHMANAKTVHKFEPSAFQATYPSHIASDGYYHKH